MNIKFNHINIQNFRSIKNIELDLDDQGIVIVKGINNSNTNANSNGSGKSSIFQAIIFALYDSLSNGDKSVQNNITNEDFRIELDFDIDSINYKIIRTPKENLLYKNNDNISARNKTDMDKQILSILNISKDQFLDSIYLSNDTDTSLCNLSPTARKERLETITGINDLVDKFKDKIKQKQEEYENKCMISSNNKSKIEGQIDLLTNQNKDNENKLLEINRQIEEYLGEKTNLEDINNKIKDLDNENNIIEDNINKIKENIDNIGNEKIQIEKNKELYINNEYKLNESKNNINLKINDLNSNIKLIDKEIENYLKDIDKINIEIDKIKNSDHCPTCGRKYDNIDMTQLNNKINEKINEISNIQNNIKYNKNKIDINTKQINEENIKIDNINKQIEDNNKEKIEIDNIIQDKINQINELKYDWNKLEDDIKINNNKKLELNNQKDKLLQTNYEQQKINILNNIDKNNTQIKELEKQKEDIEKEYTKNNNYNLVSKNILQLVTKDFRNYLLTNSIEYLNKLLEKYSKELFINNIIKINNNDNKLNIYVDDKLYDSLSSGEKVKVKIALILAQKSLSESIGNFNCNIIILDELLAACDTTAEEIIINLILNELSNLSSLYFISHKELQIPSDKILTIVKKEDNLSYLQ